MMEKAIFAWMKLVYSILLGLLVFGLQKANTQDQHFSQFFASPLNLNPALAGSYEGSFKIGAIYRDQWRAVIDNPISTYGVGGDLRYELPFTNKKNPDVASVGFQFFGDNAALYDLNTNQLSVFFAYHKALDKRTKQYLGLGFQIGIAQRNINYEDLLFGDQFNNQDAFDQQTAELLPVNNFAYGDYGIGLHYTITPSKYFNFNTGYSLAHFHTPNISFFENLDVVNPDLERVNELYMKHSAYINTEFRVSGQLRVSPRVLFLSQGPHLELNAGAGFRIARNEAARQAFHLGSFLRPVRDADQYALDALIVLAGFEYDNMLIGLSYDIGLRDLINDRQGIGIFEFSISYIGDYENDTNFCPSF